MPYCQKCGKEIDENAVFCPNCGLSFKDSDTPYQKSRSSKWNLESVLAVFFGGIIVLASFGLMIGGGALVWAQNTFSDSEGFLITSEVTLQVESHAMVLYGVNIDLDVNVPRYVWQPKPSDFVTIKLQGKSNNPSNEVFIGIAKEEDASEYFNGVEYDEINVFSWSITPWESRPHISYETHEGTTPSNAPIVETFWETSITGSGTQILEWEPELGNYWIVVMNADGSSTVDVEIQMGAKIPILNSIAILLFAGGIISLIAGCLITYFGAVRPRRNIQK